MQRIKSGFFLFDGRWRYQHDEYENAIDEIANVMQHVAKERKIRLCIAEFFTETARIFPRIFECDVNISRKSADILK